MYTIQKCVLTILMNSSYINSHTETTWSEIVGYFQRMSAYILCDGVTQNGLMFDKHISMINIYLYIKINNSAYAL